MTFYMWSLHTTAQAWEDQHTHQFKVRDPGNNRTQVFILHTIVSKALPQPLFQSHTTSSELSRPGILIPLSQKAS